MYYEIFDFLHFQTAVISYDYLTAFRDVEYGTERYWALRSEVSLVSVFIKMQSVLVNYTLLMLLKPHYCVRRYGYRATDLVCGA